MIRYVKQRDNSSCGPVAIMNALKWAGYEFSYREGVDQFQQICSWRPIAGTTHSAFDRGIRVVAGVFGIHVRRVHNPSLEEVENHLRGGGIAVMNYIWRNKKKGEFRHFVLLTEVSESGKTFVSVNDHRKGPAARRCTRASLKKGIFRFQRTDGHFKTWLISALEQEL